MTTKTKVKFSEQSKCIVTETSVESDSMTPEDVLKTAKKLADVAQDMSAEMTMDRKE